MNRTMILMLGLATLLFAACTASQTTTVYRKDAVRYGWTIVKGEENEGYLPLIARLGAR